MKQKHRDAIIKSTKIKSEEELILRAHKCAKHLLLGVSFRELSEITLKLTGSTLLAPIGFYYSLFHTGVGLVNINCMIEINSLKKIKHNYLINILNTEFVQKGILDKDFLDLLIDLKSYREVTNYRMDEYSFVDTSTGNRNLLFDFFDRSKMFYNETDKAFESAIQLIKEIASSVEQYFDFISSIQLYIGDSKGDDLLQTYFSDNNVQEKYGNILLGMIYLHEIK